MAQSGFEPASFVGSNSLGYHVFTGPILGPLRKGEAWSFLTGSPPSIHEIAFEGNPLVLSFHDHHLLTLGNNPIRKSKNLMKSSQ